MLQIRAHLRDIFAEAVDQDFLPKDPARKVEVPRQLRETDTTVLSWDQLRSVLATTTDVYMQEIPESVKATVEAISKELRLKPETAEAS